MKLARTTDDATIESDRPDAIESWLDMLTRVLKLPDDERSGIRDELEGHLRERVRDLMIGGMSEGDATRTAIGELGDAATLANRFEHARRPGRRFLMHAAILAIAGAGLTTSILAWSGGSTPPTISPTSSALPDSLVESRLSLDDGQPLEEVLRTLASISGHTLYIHANVLGDHGISLDEPLQFTLEDATVSTTMRLLNESLDIHTPIEMRVIDDVLEVSTREYFDRLETVITMYDLRDALPEDETRWERADQICDAIQQLIESDGWVNNGGVTSSIHLVEHRMFVSAPPRIQHQVAWILDRLDEDAPGTPGRGHRTGVSTDPDASPGAHVVEPGESLHSIATRHGTTVEDLMDLNPGVEGNRINVGQSLRIGR